MPNLYLPERMSHQAMWYVLSVLGTVKKKSIYLEACLTLPITVAARSAAWKRLRQNPRIIWQISGKLRKPCKRYQIPSPTEPSIFRILRNNGHHSRWSEIFSVGWRNSSAIYAQDGHWIVTILQIFLNTKIQEILKNGFHHLKNKLKHSNA